MSSKVTHTYNDHLITRQNRAEKEFLAAFEAEKPTLENAHVLVNPYFINPLCALILFKSEKPAAATMTIHGKRNVKTSCTPSPKAPITSFRSSASTKAWPPA